MTYRIHGALLASLSAAALLLSPNESVARSAVAPAAPAPTVGRPAIAPPAAARFQHRRNNPFVYWPGGGGFYYDPGMTSQPFVDAAQPPATDVRYTYTYDVPWDWAHRFPPNVVPSDRPYVPSCPSETVTVPGRGGGEHTVNIMRCY
ncbi:hypothetical protein QA641_20220 [Bradyrhizobium sp. CB1650]|uniref:hypothetical protein n=1 Tax=Bradyrhizobium sp. CB1650 TaxID=3039153 RepID=UPI002434E11B|nr:hypothetical protein [Bradyrhizobium sp. CB1650]WGD56014.1 hypothetical protein QA641_20220 [Bradyrhizobium sp. CB1650]